MVNHKSALDQLFRALADPTRRAIVERLSLGEMSVSELAEPLPMSLPAVVQQVQRLEESNVIRTHKQGRVRICTLEPEALTRLEGWLSERRQRMQARFTELGKVLQEDEDKKV